MPVNHGSQEDFGAHVTLHALEKYTKIAQVVLANQESEPQIVFSWASISPSAVARYTVKVTHGKVKAMAGWPAHLPNPTKPCKASSCTMASFELPAYLRQLAIGFGSTSKILGVHEYLKIKSRYCVAPRKAFAFNGRQRTSRGCSSFLTPPHGSLR